MCFECGLLVHPDHGLARSALAEMRLLPDRQEIEAAMTSGDAARVDVLLRRSSRGSPFRELFLEALALRGAPPPESDPQ